MWFIQNFNNRFMPRKYKDFRWKLFHGTASRLKLKLNNSEIEYLFHPYSFHILRFLLNLQHRNSQIGRRNGLVFPVLVSYIYMGRDVCDLYRQLRTSSTNLQVIYWKSIRGRVGRYKPRVRYNGRILPLTFLCLGSKTGNRFLGGSAGNDTLSKLESVLRKVSQTGTYCNSLKIG